MKLGNFTQCTLTQALTESTTELFFEFNSPWTAPSDPEGELSTALILDRLASPTRFEIITYTGINGSELTGVKRGQHDTDAQEWPIGSYLTQDISANYLDALYQESADPNEIIRPSSGALIFDEVEYDEIVGKPWLNHVIHLQEKAEPASPAAGKVEIYLDSSDNALKAKFSNGVVVKIAPVNPPEWVDADQKENSNFGSLINVETPDNVEEGDLLVIILSVLGSSGAAFNTPSGFTQIATRGQPGTSGKAGIVAWYKIATASEPASRTVSISAFTAYNYISGRITGHASSGFLQAVSSADTGGASLGSLATPSLSVNEKSLLITGITMDGAVTAGNVTLPSGMSDISSADQDSQPQYVAKQDISSAGATGTRTWSWTPNREGFGIMFSINKP